MDNIQCSNCKYWNATKEDLHRGDGEIMDTIQLYGWCEKQNKTTHRTDNCDVHEKKS